MSFKIQFYNNYWQIIKKMKKTLFLLLFLLALSITTNSQFPKKWHTDSISVINNQLTQNKTITKSACICVLRFSLKNIIIQIEDCNKNVFYYEIKQKPVYEYDYFYFYAYQKTINDDFITWQCLYYPDKNILIFQSDDNQTVLIFY